MRGPQQQMRVVGKFDSLPCARSWCYQRFQQGPAHEQTGCLSPNGTYSAVAKPGGRGRQASCMVTKTHGWFDLQRSAAWRHSMQQQLNVAVALRRPVQR